MAAIYFIFVRNVRVFVKSDAVTTACVHSSKSVNAEMKREVCVIVTTLNKLRLTSPVFCLRAGDSRLVCGACHLFVPFDIARFCGFCDGKCCHIQCAYDPSKRKRNSDSD